MHRLRPFSPYLPALLEAAVVLTPSQACGGSAGEEPAFEVRDRAGIEVVTNFASTVDAYREEGRERYLEDQEGYQVSQEGFRVSQEEHREDQGSHREGQGNHRRSRGRATC